LREKIIFTSHRKWIRSEYAPVIKNNTITINAFLTFLVKKIEWKDVNISFNMSTTIVNRICTENLWTKLEKQLKSTITNKEQIITQLMDTTLRRNDKVTDVLGQVELKPLELFDTDEQ